MLTGIVLALLVWLFSGWRDPLSSADSRLASAPVPKRVAQASSLSRNSQDGCATENSQDGCATEPFGGSLLDLSAACRERADWAARQLGPSGSVIVREPFVLAGDLSSQQLDRLHRETIGPVAQAIVAGYLAALPSRPVTLLLFSDERSYRESLRNLFGDSKPSHFGSYRPHLRVVTLNLSTGKGTVAHELTHALVHGDFPAIPDWLNEGLASLHEEYRVVGDGLRLEGLVNWRLPILQAAIRENRLRSLESLLSSDDFHGSQERLNYAQARYFCFYLQRQGLLQRYYRRLRADIGHDPTGLATLLDMFPGRSIEQLDAEFRGWATQLKP